LCIRTATNCRYEKLAITVGKTGNKWRTAYLQSVVEENIVGKCGNKRITADT
jgi:hypothetical protein